MRSQATKEAGLQSVGETVVQGLHPMRQMGNLEHQEKWTS